MAPEDDFKNLDEKKLKYELFRALRSHESQRVITILEFEKESVNWKHGYGGHSVLLQTLFENDPIVFNYLLTRDDLDLNAKDDNGHDIFYWMQFSGSNAAIDYKSRLIEVRGSIGQKLHHAAESKIKSNFVESEAMRRQDPQQAPLSLNIGTRYRLKVTFGPLKSNEIVTYMGTHTESAERWDDTFDDFKRADGKIVSMLSLASTVEKSFNIFLDVEEDLDGYPKSIRPLIKNLEYRSVSVRSQAATTIRSPLDEYEYVVPVLFRLAMLERGKNEFLDALCRIKKEALPWVESQSDLPASGEGWGYEWILSMMGSLKYLDSYHAMLSYNGDPLLIRRAIAHIVNIADPSSKAFLESLKEHGNFNIRSDVGKALAMFEGI